MELPVIVGTTLLAFLVIAAADRPRNRKPRASRSAPAIVDTKDFGDPFEAQARQVAPFVVEPLPGTGETSRDADLARRLTALAPMPDRRLLRFSWLNGPDFRFEGWHAFIEKAQATPTGYVVTLRVTPRVTASHGGSTTVIDFTRERYELAGEQWSYLGPANSNEVPRIGYLTD